jgi:hypothetical protein
MVFLLTGKITALFLVQLWYHKGRQNIIIENKQVLFEGK